MNLICIDDHNKVANVFFSKWSKYVYFSLLIHLAGGVLQLIIGAQYCIVFPIAFGAGATWTIQLRDD